MHQSSGKHVKIRGISTAVPANKRGIEQLIPLFGADIEKIQKSTGVQFRHIAEENTTTTDLCCFAAQKLLNKLDYEKDKINVLILVTQTPDYILPSSAHIAHKQLQLSKSCIAFDVNLGCSGYVYGYWLATMLLQNPDIHSVLLLAGDTISKVISPQDRSVLPLFGDAGSATLIESDPQVDSTLFFTLGSDGQGTDNLIIPAGGFREKKSKKTRINCQDTSGNLRSQEDLFMNGSEIFAFTLKTVPDLIGNVLKLSNHNNNDIDYFIFHQANLFMLQHLIKKMGLNQEKCLTSLEQYGNTSSASIPITLSHCLPYSKEKIRLLLAGFGVGYSWGACILSIDENTVITEVYLVPNREEMNEIY